MVTPAPQRIGRYEIVRRVASGGMGSVYLAKLRGEGEFSRTFAVKVCHPHLQEEAGFRSAFLQEARLAALIRHPNVVPVLEVGQDEALYMVMDYVDGWSLDRLLDVAAPQGGMPLPVALRITLDTLRGLEAAHDLTDEKGVHLGLVHRDVSPHNLLVGVDGRTLLADFGIARANDSSVRTASGTVKGKVGYMAPEQARGSPPTCTTDLFSTGVVLWELSTGTSMRDGDTTESQLLQCIMQVYRSVGAGRDPAMADARLALDAVLERAMDRDPAERYSSAKELGAALRGIGVLIADHEAVRAYIDTLQVPRLSLAAPQESAPTVGSTKTALATPATARMLTPSQGPPPPSPSMPPAAPSWTAAGPPRSSGTWLAPPERRNWLAALGVGVVALAAGIAISFFMRGGSASTAGPTPRTREGQGLGSDGDARSAAAATGTAVRGRPRPPASSPTAPGTIYRPKDL